MAGMIGNTDDRPQLTAALSHYCCPSTHGTFFAWTSRAAGAPTRLTWIAKFFPFLR